MGVLSVSANLVVGGKVLLECKKLHGMQTFLPMFHKFKKKRMPFQLAVLLIKAPILFAFYLTY